MNRLLTNRRRRLPAPAGADTPSACAAGLRLAGRASMGDEAVPFGEAGFDGLKGRPARKGRSGGVPAWHRPPIGNLRVGRSCEAACGRRLLRLPGLVAALLVSAAALCTATAHAQACPAMRRGHRRSGGARPEGVPDGHRQRPRAASRGVPDTSALDWVATPDGGLATALAVCFEGRGVGARPTRDPGAAARSGGARLRRGGHAGDRGIGAGAPDDRNRGRVGRDVDAHGAGRDDDRGTVPAARHGVGRTGRVGSDVVASGDGPEGPLRRGLRAVLAHGRGLRHGPDLGGEPPRRGQVPVHVARRR